ncbi:hypothetical protein B0H11DRAFT_1944247 [Mycena galericulata]|nr:hypothetical protein B0H11DRAFT_1944247 [Mycena galericulata]
MGLEEDDDRYNRHMRMIKRYIQEHLSVFHPISEQDRGKVELMIKIAAAADGADVASEDEPPRKRLKTHRKQIGESEEEDADDEVEKPVKTTVAKKRPQKVFVFKSPLFSLSSADSNAIPEKNRDSGTV